MGVTIDQLLAIMPTATRRGPYYLACLNDTMDEFNIQDPNVAAMFLAQLAHESGELRYTHELWGPTPAQAGYEGRMDLGNTEPGDGEKFKGHGFIQITGRLNHRMCSLALYGDERLLEDPTPITVPPDVARSAGWFWDTFKNLTPIAEQGNEAAFELVTRRINGGYNGLAQREDYWAKAKNALGVP